MDNKRVGLNHSAGLEQQHGHLPHVEVDEVLGLMGHVRSKVTAYNAVPSGVVLLVELFFNVGGDVLFDVEFFEGDVGAVDSVLLHLFVHVCMFNHGFFLCGGH